MITIGTCPANVCQSSQLVFPQSTTGLFGDILYGNGLPSWYGTIIEGQTDASGYVYRRNRYLDPTSGRFTQEDPIGLAGGLNNYGYAGGDPVNYSDPLGLCDPLPACLLAVASATSVAVPASGEAASASALAPVSAVALPALTLAAATAAGYLALRPAFPTGSTRLTRTVPGSLAPAEATVVYSKGKIRRLVAGLGMIFGGVVGAPITGNEHLPEPPREEQEEPKKDKRPPKGAGDGSSQ